LDCGEDPATGTAAVPLGALLVACGVSEFGRIIVEQATAMDRTSFISVDFGEGTVCIGGARVVTASV
jgi:predicted PhzF superfamily epimerase YddE/YHI9